MKHDTIISQAGFTLVEMAIVLFLMMLVLGSGLTLLSAQQDQQRIEETRIRLDDAREALIGFAIAHGRLPCPASSSSNGIESFAVGGNAANGNCSNFNDGFLPAASLGLTRVDNQGYALDAWSNRIRYAVTASNSNAFTKTDGIKMSVISSLAPDLLVCVSAAAPGFSGTSCGANNGLTSTPGVPAVIHSTGANGNSGGTSTDEAKNPNPNSSDNDHTFVSHSPAPAEARDGYFDDQVSWLSTYILFNRMVQAGKLP